MKAHELANLLLDGPNHEVLFGPHEGYALEPISVAEGMKADPDTDDATPAIIVEVSEDDCELE
jgi:hypothetical protein